MKLFINKTKELFSADSRSLALFRISLASLIIFDLINRARDLTAHYTSKGVLPLDILLDKFVNFHHLSVYFLGDSFIFVSFLFLLGFLFAFMLLFGYKTKLATIVSWILLMSLQTRNPMVLQGGDTLLRLLLFWAIFLPLGKTWAIDSKIKKQRKYFRIFSIGVIGIFLQTVFLYFFAGLLKTGRDWYPDGTAIYYALSIDQFTTNFGLFLLNFPNFLQFLTFFVLFYWMVGPFLLFFPIYSNKIRIFTISIFISLQLGMMFAMKLGLFPLVAIVSLFPLIPSYFYDNLLPRFKINKFKSEFILKVNQFKIRKSPFFKTLIILIVSFFIVYIFLWNLQTLGDYDLNDDYEFIAHKLRLDQKWNMFSPYPLKDDGWYVIPGTLINGQEIDLFSNKEVTYEKPPLVSNTYKNQRWRKYMMNLWQKKNGGHINYYATYLCNNWNSNHFDSEKLIKFEINYMREDTLPNYEVSKVEKVNLWNQEC